MSSTQTISQNVCLLQPGTLDWSDLHIATSRRYHTLHLNKSWVETLKELVVIQLRQGSNSAWVKKDFDGEFERFDFLLKKVKRDGLPINDLLREERRGIPQEKYDAIIKDLVPLIEQVDGGNHAWRAGFYHDLVCSDTSVDLAQADDEDPADDHQ